MNNFINELHYLLTVYLVNSEFWYFYLMFFPLVLFIEFPLYIFIILSAFKVYWKEAFTKPYQLPFYPDVTCIITCYSEGYDIIRTIKSIVEQLYKGNIEILIMVDGAIRNKNTFDAAKMVQKQMTKVPKRYVKVIPKKIRGGHASSNNLGLRLAKGEFVILLDGDCSCDNDFVSSAVYNFIDKNVVGVSGNIRVRNSRKNVLTSLQAIEYMFGIQLARTGLSSLNILNNISGAFGFFRKDFLNRIGGWKNGSGEDLDLVVRIKGYFKRYPKMKMIHDHYATAHTDVPETWVDLFKQRLRWDGDLYYVYFRRYWKLLNPKFLGWRSLLGVLWYDIFFCMMVPVFTIIYSIYMLTFYTHVFFVSIMIVTYIYYLIWSLAIFLFYIILCSERKKNDLSFIVYIPLMPIYQFVMRLWTAVATVCEIFMHTHKDTTMGPWWVIKKTH
jgi:poly-beta-1,6-N-acetyl-D-glucosamine synthase